MTTTTLNPRTALVQFLQRPLPQAVLAGGSSTGASAQGIALWNINAPVTWNSQTNSVPLLAHETVASSVAATAFPNTTDLALWFDRATGALRGLSCYGGNRTEAAVGGFAQHDWIIDLSGTLTVPNQNYTVNWLTNSTFYTGVARAMTFRHAQLFPATGQGNAYAVGAEYTPSALTAQVQVTASTVNQPDTYRIRWAVTRTHSGTASVKNHDLFFTTTGFSHAILPSKVIVKTSATTYATQSSDILWTKVSGWPA